MIWPEELDNIQDDGQRFTVLRDTREHENNGWYWKANDRCAGTIDIALKTGDYTLKGFEDVLAIERKASVAEIAHNLTEKRFPKVLERLSKFKHSFIVVECSFQDVLNYPIGSAIPKHKWPDIRLKGDSLLRKLFEAQVQFGTNIIWAGSIENAWTAVYCIFKRVYESRKN